MLESHKYYNNLFPRRSFVHKEEAKGRAWEESQNVPLMWG
jgi:hypothetical protein